MCVSGGWGEGGSPRQWGAGGVREVGEDRVEGGSSSSVRSGRSRAGKLGNNA